MKSWEPFRDLWEVDKIRFIERYASSNPTAAQFDADNGRYIEVANNVQIQENTTHVHFMMVICTDLKRSIIDHCVEWQNKLCQLLYKLTIEKLDYVYEYIKSNSEL